MFIRFFQWKRAPDKAHILVIKETLQSIRRAVRFIGDFRRSAYIYPAQHQAPAFGIQKPMCVRFHTLFPRFFDKKSADLFGISFVNGLNYSC
jgi:hypothetical protein